MDLEFSPDGKMLASASWDRTIKLWDLKGNVLATLSGHQEEVFDVAFSPDGELLASASGDGTVRLWQRVNTSERYIRAYSSPGGQSQFPVSSWM